MHFFGTTNTIFKLPIANQK